MIVKPDSRCMAFEVGQQVRLKKTQHTGTVSRKLHYLDHMYVVLMDGNHKPQKKLAHESEMEVLLQDAARLSA